MRDKMIRYAEVNDKGVTPYWCNMLMIGRNYTRTNAVRKAEESMNILTKIENSQQIYVHN